MTDNEFAVELLTLIDEIEKHKAIIVGEFDDLKETYHADRYRKIGYTKRQIEDKMNRLTGETLGHEYALSYLYRRFAKLEGGET